VERCDIISKKLKVITMGVCKYCGKPAGLFRSEHKECKERREVTWKQMVSLVEETILQQGSDDAYKSLKEELKKMGIYGYITSEEEITEALISGWERAVDRTLEDGKLEESEEKKISKFVRFFGFSQSELDRRGYYSKFVKSIVLREVMEGKVPESVKIRVENVDINFQKDEKLIWIFTDVDYLEARTVRRYSGSSSGLSIRIAKGVYFHTGNFRGNPIETTEVVRVDTGIVAVTTKHIYFHGSVKSFRIPYKKIISFVPFSDGIGFFKDSPSSKLQCFKTNDGWFTYNLIVNVSKKIGQG